MTSDLIALILGGFLMTYLPRTIPLHLQSLKIPAQLEKYLLLMPMAALGALILPGALDVLPQAPWVALLSVTAAGIWSFFRGGLIFPVVLSLGMILAFQSIL